MMSKARRKSGARRGHRTAHARAPLGVRHRETIYQGKVIRLIREQLELRGQRLYRETILHPGAVVILPVLADERIVFIRQYRRAIRRYLLELPAGTLDHGESKATCAKRELLEETGYRARRVTRLAQFYAAPGFLSEQLTLFIAEDLSQGQAAPEPDELVEPIILTLNQALAKIRSGKLCDAKSMIGVLFLRDRLNSATDAR